MSRVGGNTDIGKGRPITVIGSGFSGLSAAHHLNRAGFKVTVRERARGAGGMLQTVRKDCGLIETAANGILNSVWVEDLFEAAGVTMLPTLKAARSRFIFRNGRARRFPLSLLEALRLPSFLAKLMLARARLAPFPQESLAHWGSRVLSKTASRYSIETAFQGVYAGDPTKLSATLLLGALFRPVRPPIGKVEKGFRGTVAPLGGMGELVHSLRRRLEERGVEFKFADLVKSEDLARAENPVVIATEISSAAELLEELDAERACTLRAIETLPLVTITAFFEKGTMPLEGFGCLFPPGEAEVLGVLFNHHIFAERTTGFLSETWILGGALKRKDSREVTTLSDRELIDIVVRERAKLMNRTQSPDPHSFQITRWAKALPHFTTELERALSKIQDHQGRIYLHGNYAGGIGLAKILERAAGLPSLIADTGKWVSHTQQADS